MGYEMLLLLPVAFFGGTFLVHHAEKLRWKVTFLILHVLFYFFFFLVYPSPVGVDLYARRLYWRGPTNNLDMNRTMGRARDGFLSALGIQVVTKKKWYDGGEYIEYAENKRREEENGK